MFDFLFLFLGRPSMSMVVNSQLITRALAENEALRVWNVPLIVSVHPNISQKARGKVLLHASCRDEVRGKVHSLLSEACEKVCLRQKCQNRKHATTSQEIERTRTPVGSKVMFLFFSCHPDGRDPQEKL